VQFIGQRQPLRARIERAELKRLSIGTLFLRSLRQGFDL
jgi:hypothetical protein